MNFYDIIVPTYTLKPFTYQSDEVFESGQIVLIPLKNRVIYGVVLNKVNPPEFQARNIECATSFVLQDGFLRFLLLMEKYTLAPLGMIMRMVIPGDISDVELKDDSEYSYRHVDLTDEQDNAINTIHDILAQRKPILIDGVTGSGKTEVYLNIAQRILALDQQILLLLPEIALTQQLIERISNRFNRKPLVWHSAITPKNKKIVWQKIMKDEPCIVIGARSALFLPFKNLGLIVVDEEHDGSYKQESHVYYHARDMAIMRANMEQIPVILASATPSIETMVNVKKGKYGYVELTKRYGEAEYPEIIVAKADIKENLISELLMLKMKEKLAKNQQILLFLNRRGYAPTLMCPHCGYKLMCPHCSISLVVHKKNNTLKCHHCGFVKKLQKFFCPKHREELFPWGPGVERVASEVEILFPSARTILMTSDFMTTPKKIEEAIKKIHKHEVDIIIGTQILAKGHHFPKLTLVGIIDGDISGIELKQAERTYQLLHQVAGRAGREKEKGEVVIQTLCKEHPVIQALLNWDRESFMQYEIEDRQKHQVPPFGQLASIILSSKNIQSLKQYMYEINAIKPKSDSVFVYGPSPAPLSYLQGQHRYRILLQTELCGFTLQEYIHAWLTVPCPSNVKQIIDINPQSFY